MRRALAITLFLATLAVPAFGQDNWGLRTGIGLEKGISKGFDASLEAKLHQTDNLRATDRWSIGISLSKRLYRNKAKTFNVKAAAGYKFLSVNKDWSTKFKGDSTLIIPDGMEPLFYKKRGYDFNYYDTYTELRHRLTASVQASYEIGQFKFSLREMYQYTYTDSTDYAVYRYRYANTSRDKAWADKKGYTKVPSENYYLRTDTDGKPASSSNVLRSRISIDYNIPHWKYDPFISYELFNNLDNSFKAEKSRITAGVDFSFKKKHDFEIAYMWQNQHDDDEPAGSFICLSYKFNL